MNIFKGEAEGNIRDLEHARSLPADVPIDSSPRARTLTGGSLRSVRSQQSTPSPPGVRRTFVRSPSLPSSPSLDSGDEKINEEIKEEEPVVARSAPARAYSVSFRDEDLEPYRQRMETMSPILAKIPSAGEFDGNVDMEEETGSQEAEIFSFRPPNEETENESKMNSFRSALQKFGDHLPEWMTDPIRNPPGWSRTAAFAVRYWPCFLCSPLETGATDRAILMRLNLICTFFSIGLVTAGSFLFLVIWWDRIVDRDINIDDGVTRGESNSFIPNLWNLNGNVMANGVVGAITLIVMIMARPVVRQVNLVGALRFMWVLLWILPVELVFTIGLFDLHDATDVWVKQYWTTYSMAWFREKFCRPSDTANTKCVVPIGGGAGFADEEEWCMEFFGATDCSMIRHDAETRTDRFLSGFYYTVAAWGVLFIIYLILTVRILSAIITRPIVQASRESNVPAWLTLPIIGGFTVGFILAFSPSSVVSTQTGGQVWWIGVVYITIGGLFAFAALLGWGLSVFAILNNRDKRHKSLLALLFILVMLLTVTAVSTLFIVSIVFSTNIASIPLKDSERGQFACAIDRGNSCTNCGNSEGLRECPEWTTENVMAVVRTSLKLSATVAAIFWVYAVGALRFGILLRRHILMYQIAYV